MEQNELFYNDTISNQPDELEKMLRALFAHCLSFVPSSKPAYISVTLTDDPSIHAINREYRKIDRPTDVISFAYNDEGSDGDEPVNDLGEVVISLDTALRQAEFYKHPCEREIAFLFIHSFLHLNGYDHLEQDEAEKMFSLQNKILNSFEYTYVPIMKKEDSSDGI